MKPIDSFAFRWELILQQILKYQIDQDLSEKDRILSILGTASIIKDPSNNNSNQINRIADKYHIVIVGGGAGGVELAFAIHYRIQFELRKLNQDPNRVEITLVTRGSQINSNIELDK